MLVAGRPGRADSCARTCSALLAAVFGLAIDASAATVKDNLYGVKALSAAEAVAVGNFGSIYTTTDGGKNWNPRTSGVTEPLFSVDFADARHGVAVGKSATIIVTTNGGETWKAVKSPISADKHFFKAAMPDPKTIWAVGDWGAITVSRDGGATWKDLSLGTVTIKQEVTPGRQTQVISDDVILYDVQFMDAEHGYIAGEFGTLLATADGGETWEKRETGTEKTLFGIGFADAQAGWAVGMDGLVLRTKDGGRTWERQRGRGEDEALEDVGFAETLKNPGLYAVRVIGRTGVVAGDTGLLLTTADGGDTWAQLELPAKQRLTWMRDVSVLPGGDGFVVGAAGFLAKVEKGKVILPEPSAASAAAEQH